MTSGNSRHDGGRRRSTSDRRHNNAAGVGDGRNSRIGWDRSDSAINTGEGHNGDGAGGSRNDGACLRRAWHLGRVRASDKDRGRRGHADGAGTG